MSKTQMIVTVLLSACLVTGHISQQKAINEHTETLDRHLKYIKTLIGQDDYNVSQAEKNLDNLRFMLENRLREAENRITVNEVVDIYNDPFPSTYTLYKTNLPVEGLMLPKERTPAKYHARPDERMEWYAHEGFWYIRREFKTVGDIRSQPSKEEFENALEQNVMSYEVDTIGVVKD